MLEWLTIPLIENHRLTEKMLVTLHKRIVKVYHRATRTTGDNEFAFSINGVNVVVRLPDQHVINDCLSNLTHEYVFVKGLVRVHRQE